jgi:CheY-like chemotaxis protein
VPLPRRTQPTVEIALGALLGRRALVVDGNAVSRTALANALQTWGFVVDQVATAEEALDLYSWTGPDADADFYALALVDYQMDGIDGVRLARDLRSRGPAASTVILLLSSDPDVSRQAAHDAGIESVLIKPVRNAYLLRRIMDALITKKGTPDVASAPR